MMRLLEQMRGARPGAAFTRLKDMQLSHAHMRVIQLLAPERVLAMKDLADELHLTPPSLTALTRRLVQTGLVTRSAREGDSRVVLLSLTPAGRELHDELEREHLERMAELLQGLEPEEQQQFLDLLERAVDALLVEARERPDPALVPQT